MKKRIKKYLIPLAIISLAIVGLLIFYPSPLLCSSDCPIKLSSNQIQPVSYIIQPSTSSLIPFKTASVLDPRDNTISYILVTKTSIDVSLKPLPNPQYKLYPTTQQLQEFEAIISRVNAGSQTYADKIKLTILWFQIKKVKS